jgi:hypothetical protein
MDNHIEIYGLKLPANLPGLNGLKMVESGAGLFTLYLSSVIMKDGCVETGMKIRVDGCSGMVFFLFF